jgi:hypothetical protein
MRRRSTGSASASVSTVTHHPGRTSVWADYERSLAGEETGDAALTAQSAQGANRADWAALAVQNARKTADSHAGVGSVDEVRRNLEAYEAAGTDELMLLLPPARHEFLMESLTLLGEQVLPAFRERDEEAQRSKAARLEPVIEKVLARYESTAPDLDPDYWFGGVPRSWDGGSAATEVQDAMLTAARLRAAANGEG